MTIVQKGGKMSDLNHDLHARAVKALSENEVRKMEHCVGFDRKKIYHRGGTAYYKPYRNYYDAGGTDMRVWERLVEKGFADCAEPKKDGGKYYWLNRNGLNILSAYEECFIYSENANGNEIDASEDVIDILLEDAVYCGYGCWIPSGARNIAIRARLPYKLTLSTLKYLRNKCGYVAHYYEGGCNDEGFPHCTHGWVLTKKWLDENKERVDKRQQEEYERLDRILREPVVVLDGE